METLKESLDQKRRELTRRGSWGQGRAQRRDSIPQREMSHWGGAKGRPSSKAPSARGPKDTSSRTQRVGICRSASRLQTLEQARSEAASNRSVRVEERPATRASRSKNRARNKRPNTMHSRRGNKRRGRRKDVRNSGSQAEETDTGQDWQGGSLETQKIKSSGNFTWAT